MVHNTEITGLHGQIMTIIDYIFLALLALAWIAMIVHMAVKDD